MFHTDPIALTRTELLRHRAILYPQRPDQASPAHTVEAAPVQSNRLMSDMHNLLSYRVERGWTATSPARLLTQQVAPAMRKAERPYCGSIPASRANAAKL